MRLCPKCGAKYGLEVETCGRDGAVLIETFRDPLLGAKLGDFEPIELIGSGGMAQVYRARHLARSGRYAIKVLAGPAADDVTSRERFAREAAAIQKISHPNVVSLIDFGTTPSGRRYLVMEWCEGRELNEAIKLEAPFAVPRAAWIARQIALGLSAIHRAGFVHRDVKPHNVMLARADRGADETVKIVDFGLVYADSGLWEKLTRCGDIVGTPFYIAPETIEGDEADARTDLYSLGVIIYEMIAGRPPFASALVPEILAMHLRSRPEPLPDCGGLDLLAGALLEKDPDRRPQSAEDVLERLEGLDLTTAAGMRMPSLRTIITQPSLPPVADLDGNIETVLEANLDGTIDANMETNLDTPGLGTPRTRPALEQTSNYPRPTTVVLPPRVPDLTPWIPNIETSPYPLDTERVELDEDDPELNSEADPTEALVTTVADATDTPPLSIAAIGDALSAVPRDGLGSATISSTHESSISISHGDLGGRSISSDSLLEGLKAGVSIASGSIPGVSGPDMHEPASETQLSSPSEMGIPALPMAPSPIAPPATAPPQFAMAAMLRPIPMSPRDVIGEGHPRGTPRPRLQQMHERAHGSEKSQKFRFNAAHGALALLLLVLLLAGIGIGYLVEQHDRPSSNIVKAQLPNPNLPEAPQPRAIARQPEKTEPSPAPVVHREPPRQKERPRRQPLESGGGGREAAAAGGEMGELERDLKRAASSRGFASSDLAYLETTASHYEAWLEAKKNNDVARAKAVLTDLERGLDGRSPDTDFLRKRSDEIGLLLQSSKSSISDARFKVLAARHWELATKVEEATDLEGARALAKLLRRLRADVGRARRTEP